MTGLEIAAILIGIIGGNLGAVVLKPLNIGLFWNSVCGGIGAIAITFAPGWLNTDLFDFWLFDFVAAALAGMGLMIIAGALVALRFRG